MRSRNAAATALALLLLACGQGTQASVSASARRATPTAPAGPLMVFAAASLTDAFEAIGERFEREHPEVEVTFNFAGSSTLATQLRQGAPADVFASADERQMKALQNAQLVTGEPTLFATNSLQIVVEPGNPPQIGSLGALTQPDVTVLLAAEEVPAGEYARTALDARDLELKPASLERDVRAVLARVALGEADAGIVYRSDVVAAGDRVEGAPIPAEENVTARYPIARLAAAPNPGAGEAFVAFVQSPAGQRILHRFGFSAP